MASDELLKDLDLPTPVSEGLSTVEEYNLKVGCSGFQWPKFYIV